MVLTGLTLVLSNTYFSKSIFFVHQNKYKLISSNNNSVSYGTRSHDAPSLKVYVHDQDRKVWIDKEEYSIHSYQNVTGSNTYEVIYPSGHKYEVVDQSGFLLAYDEKKEYVPEISLYANGQRITQDGDEEFFPSELVIAAYPEHHTKQGSIILFIFSWLLLIFGWCSFRYEKFQNFLFLISLRWIWTNDHEPSDFYYFMSKVGGIIVMIGSVVLAIKSFFIY